MNVDNANLQWKAAYREVTFADTCGMDLKLTCTQWISVLMHWQRSGYCSTSARQDRKETHTHTHAHKTHTQNTHNYTALFYFVANVLKYILNKLYI